MTEDTNPITSKFSWLTWKVALAFALPAASVVLALVVVTGKFGCSFSDQDGNFNFNCRDEVPHEHEHKAPGEPGEEPTEK